MTYCFIHPVFSTSRLLFHDFCAIDIEVNQLDLLSFHLASLVKHARDKKILQSKIKIANVSDILIYSSVGVFIMYARSQVKIKM